MRLNQADDAPLFLENPHSVDHRTAKLDDRNVAGAETLLGSIRNSPHRFPHHDVLVRNPRDPGEAAILHQRTILQIIIVGVTLDRPELRIDVFTDDQETELSPRLGTDTGLI